MDERINKWLIDICNAIDEIDAFKSNQTKTLFDYENNLILKRAVERNLEIIGEAMNRIITRDPSYLTKISEARNIVGLRNLIIHNYDGVSDQNIWSILIEHLPVLKKEIDTLLNQ